MTIFDDGDETVVPEATFPLYETIGRAMRATVVASRMRGYRIDLDDMLQRITSRTKAVWLCNPNNPTGTLVEAEEFGRFYEKVPPSVLVIHDEVYRDFADPERFPDTVQMIRRGAENLFLLRSCSKLYGMAGVRLGFGMGAEELIGLMHRARPPFDVSVPAQEAARAALGDRRFVRRTLRLNRRGMDYLAAELGRLGLRWAPSETNFILLDTGRDSREVCRGLEGFGIIARAADKYGYPNHIRVTVGRRDQNRRFVRALEEICSSG
jgi:histidinol-phosphate aminotransferase